MSGPIVLGRFGRPHGVRGQIRFWPFNPETAMVKKGTAMVGTAKDRTQALTVTLVRRDAKSHVVAFDGITDRDVVNAFNGSMWFVERSGFPAPGDDEVYHVDLVGAPVSSPDGADLGTLIDIRTSAATDLLVIRHGGRDHLVPNVDFFVERLQVDGIVVRPIDGLFGEAEGDGPE